MRGERFLLVPTLLILLLLGAGCSTSAASARSTPNPEGIGPTAGPGTISVVGLGDSVMSGEHCNCGGPMAAYATLLRSRLNRPVGVVNLGVPGATTTSVLTQLNQSNVIASVRSAKVVALIIGANDLYPQLHSFQSGGCSSSCYMPAVKAVGQRLDAILDRIDQIRGGHHGQVILTDYWNVFIDGATAEREEGSAYIAWSREISRAVNQEICGEGAKRHDQCADTYAAFLSPSGDPTRYLASDGDHPNDAGVQVIAEQLMKVTDVRALR